MRDIRLPKGMCSELQSRDLFKFCKISDNNILETVQDRDIVAKEDY